MTRWGLVLGTLALLLVFVGSRASVSPPVAAQSATPAADAATADPYHDFLAKLATNLGVGDAAAVEAAIRTTLKQTVDERQAAGDLSAADAAEIKERIDAADVPLGMLGRLGRLGGHRGGFDGGRHGGPFDGHDRGMGPHDGPFLGRDRDDRTDPTDRDDDRSDAAAPADDDSELPETGSSGAAATFSTQRPRRIGASDPAGPSPTLRSRRPLPYPGPAFSPA